MNRGRISPVVLFALSLWSVLFVSGAVPGFLFPLTGLLCLAIAITLGRLGNPRWRRTGLALGFLGLGVWIGGFAAPESGRWDRYSRLFGASSAYTAIPVNRIGEFQGVLSADSTAVPGSSGNLSRYPVKLEKVASADGAQRGSARGHVLVWSKDGPPLFRGQEITVYRGLIPYRKPGRFAYLCRAKPQELTAGAFRRPIDSLRSRIFSAVLQRVRELDPPVSALLAALLLGRREELHGSIYELFRTSGSLHLLALSGLHLGILYFFLFLVLGFVRDRRVRRFAAGALLLGYLLLVGWRPSLERAMVMLLVAAAGYALDREAQPLNLLALAASLLLLLRSYYAFDLSFQLSFISLGAVFLLGPYLYRLWQPYLPAFLGWPLGISMSAQIGTAPLVLYHFGALYPVGILAALPVIPLVTLFLGGGLLFVAFCFLPLPVSGWLEQGLLSLYRGIVFFLELFSRVPGIYSPWRSLYWGLLALLLVPSLVELAGRRRIRSC
jgi:ComEC/Rec2-related protein